MDAVQAHQLPERGRTDALGEGTVPKVVHYPRIVAYGDRGLVKLPMQDGFDTDADDLCHTFFKLLSIETDRSDVVP